MKFTAHQQRKLPFTHFFQYTKEKITTTTTLAKMPHKMLALERLYFQVFRFLSVKCFE